MPRYGVAVIVVAFVGVSIACTAPTEDVGNCPPPPAWADADWPRHVSNAKLRQFQRDAILEARAYEAGSDERFFAEEEARNWGRLARNNPRGICLSDLLSE